MRHRQKRRLWPNIWYGIGLIVAVAVLVGVQVLPKLEQYRLKSGGSPTPTSEYGGAKWRLISLSPGAEDAEKGTRLVTAIIGTTPVTRAGGEKIRKGCDVSVRDARDRVWSPALGLEAGAKGVKDDMPGSCNPDGKDEEPITVPVGRELRFQTSFEVAADAVNPLRVEVRLERTHDSFVRLAL